MVTAPPPVRCCTMPECGQPMQARIVPPSAVGAVQVVAYRCGICDVRRCQCDYLVQEPSAPSCPNCRTKL